MKLTVQHHNLRSTHELDSLIEDRILALRQCLQIDEAHVRLECRFQDSPAFGVRIHLVVPGPDMVVEGRDHTIKAAVNRAMAAIQTRLAQRQTRRLRRVQGNLRSPSARSRNGHARGHHVLNH